MESSDTEPLNTTTSPVNSDHHDQTNAHIDLMTLTPPGVENVTLHPSKKILRSSSSSSSPDSPLDDPFHNDDYDDDNNDNDNHDDKSKSTVEVKSPCDIVSSTQAPPNQVMENPDPSPSTPAYRIPPSVFERSPSSTPMEWSTASNESLFSVYGGNMSFTNDQYLWRSGELGPPGEEAACSSDHMFSYSGHQGGEYHGAVADMRSRELGLAETIMKEVIQESEGQQIHEQTKVEARSQGSNRSNQSFAFSLVTEKGGSTRMPSSGRGSSEPAQSQTQTKTVVQSDTDDPNAKKPMSTGYATKCQWFSCLTSCTMC